MFKGFMVALLIFFFTGTVYGFRPPSKLELIILLAIAFLMPKRIKEPGKKGKK